MIELQDLLTNGFILCNKSFQLKVRAFVCDAPARSFELKSKGHTGSFPGVECVQKGTLFNKKVIFPYEQCELRTSDSYFTRAQIEHHHQLAPTVVETLPINIITSLPFDYMHTVTRTSLVALVKSKGRNYSLPSWKMKKLDDLLNNTRSSVPCEFFRYPRQLCDLNRWKATELRQFLPYTIVLKYVLDANRYHILLKLGLAVRILLDEQCNAVSNTCAQKMLMSFVNSVPTLLHF